MDLPLLWGAFDPLGNDRTFTRSTGQTLIQLMGTPPPHSKEEKGFWGGSYVELRSASSTRAAAVVLRALARAASVEREGEVRPFSI